MNPIAQALVNAKNYLTGRTVVDNAANPASAYSRQQRQIKYAGTGSNAQTRALQQSMAKTYPGKKGSVFGIPPGSPNQLSGGGKVNNMGKIYTPLH